MTSRNDFDSNHGYKGYLCLVLHAHLPYIRHPEHEYFLEENWLYEAMTESYIPLIKVFDGLIDDGIDFRITMTLSPTLISMLEDPLLQARYLRHLNRLIELSGKEIRRTGHQGEFNKLARMYNRRFLEAREVFVERYENKLVTAFKKFQDLGKLEIITSAATHGFLPLMEDNPEAVKTQILVAVTHYEKVFGRRPTGFWLPECGYYPGLDGLLKEAGIRYFFVDTHGITDASIPAEYGVYAPVYCPSGVAAFGRDKESSKQVWSAKEGYPGDFAYREFYRDIGFDLEYEYIRPYIHPDGIRINTGIKYYRITGEAEHKEPYIPELAAEMAAKHAANFMFNREKQAERLCSVMDRRPIIVAPYDAELFGHWWFEGPEWLDCLIRNINYKQGALGLITPPQYIMEYPVNQVSEPLASSWGYNGNNEMWLNDTNEWIYSYLSAAASRMRELAREYATENGLIKRALNQAAREVLLAQSSDWAFIMKTGTAVEYAVKRTMGHIAHFNKIYEDVTAGKIDEEWLGDVENKNNIFSDIDFRMFA